MFRVRCSFLETHLFMPVLSRAFWWLSHFWASFRVFFSSEHHSQATNLFVLRLFWKICRVNIPRPDTFLGQWAWSSKLLSVLLLLRERRFRSHNNGKRRPSQELIIYYTKATGHIMRSSCTITLCLLEGRGPHLSHWSKLIWRAVLKMAIYFWENNNNNTNTVNGSSILCINQQDCSH